MAILLFRLTAYQITMNMERLESARTVGTVGIYVEMEVREPVRRGGTAGAYVGTFYWLLEV
jgi:hypothetical protein